MSTNHKKDMLSLMANIRFALEEYEQQINKKREPIVTSNNSDKDIDISVNLKNIRSLLNVLEGHFINSTATKTNKMMLAIGKIYLPEIKNELKELEQRVINTYLATQTAKIYEQIKTLFNHLIRLFAPLEGYQLINQATKTLTNTRSKLFSQVETMEKYLPQEPESEEAKKAKIEIYRSPMVPRIYS